MQPDITLWHCKDARSFRVLWALEELGLPYRLHTLPFPPRWREPAYLETNPLGTIPFLTDGPTRMTESAAITHYLASRYGRHSDSGSGLNVEPHEPDYGAFLNFLHQGEATLTFPQTLVFRYLHLEKPENRQPKVAEDYKRWFLARTTWAEHTLADGRDWLCANRFTAADISVAYALLFAETLGHLPEVSPNLRTFWTRCQTRPAFHRAKAAQST